MQRTNVWTPTGGKWRGGGVGGGMNWEIGIDIYTLICIKWIINKNLLYKKVNKIQKFKKKKKKSSHQKKKVFNKYAEVIQRKDSFVNKYCWTN